MTLLTNEQIESFTTKPPMMDGVSYDDAFDALLSHARDANAHIAHLSEALNTSGLRVAELEKRIATLQRELAFETGASDSL